MVVGENIPTVSVIVPTYNRADLLPRAIRSVLNQTFKDFELIIVDDGSTDNTKEVVEKFQNRDKRIRYIWQKNKGVAAARNTGIKNARGEYIAFLDSDDEWLPEKLEKQLELFKHSNKKNLGFVSCNVLVQEGDRIREYKMPRYKNILQSLLESNFINGGSSVIVRREVFDDIGFFDENLKVGEDSDMWIRIAQRYDFDFVPEPLFKRHFHSSNVTRITSFETKGNLQNYLINKHKNIYKKNPKIYSSVLRGEGTWYVLGGNLSKGRECFRKSIKIYPLAIKSYFYLLVSLFGSRFYYKMSRLKTRLRQLL